MLWTSRKLPLSHQFPWSGVVETEGTGSGSEPAVNLLWKKIVNSRKGENSRTNYRLKCFLKTFPQQHDIMNSSGNILAFVHSTRFLFPSEGIKTLVIVKLKRCKSQRGSSYELSRVAERQESQNSLICGPKCHSDSAGWVVLFFFFLLVLDLRTHCTDTHHHHFLGP